MKRGDVKFTKEQKEKLTLKLLENQYGQDNEWYHLFGVLFAKEAFWEMREIGISFDDFPFDGQMIAKRLDEMKAQMDAKRARLSEGS